MFMDESLEVVALGEPVSPALGAVATLQPSAQEVAEYKLHDVLLHNGDEPGCSSCNSNTFCGFCSNSAFYAVQK